MKKNKIKVLCFFDSQKGRDVEILIPLIVFAEKYLNCVFEYSILWDIHAIYQKKPDLVLLPNTIGSEFHYRAAKYAYENNIKVFALISEGNFRTNGTFDYWGYNKDKNFFQEYICHWSQRTLNYLKREEKAFAHKMVLTGGLGFDRYKIYKFIDKISFLNEYNLNNFEKIIGYAGWAFGKIYNKQGREELIANGYPESKFEWLENQMYNVEDILKRAIVNNPDILFILKRHPNEANPSITRHDLNEMVRLKDYNNVLYLHGNENIHDLINVSDIWTGFETTTCLEAWMMGKNETLLLNPDPDFNRDDIHKGSLILKTYKEFQDYIDEYYQYNRIRQCHSTTIKQSRDRLIKNTIGFGDGLNHIRAGYYLKKTIDNINVNVKKKIYLNLRYFIMYILLYGGRVFYNKKIFLKLPKFKKTVWIFENFRFNEFFTLKSKYSTFLNEFYISKKIEQLVDNKTEWGKIL